MIVFLRGIVHTIGTMYLDIEIQGIGYRVWVSENVLHQIEVGHELFVYTYQHIREDINQLFGFLDERERTLFERLLTVSGVGPKGALQMIGATQVANFIEAVQNEDVHQLCQLPGIGKKTAQRLIVELRDKLIDLWYESNDVSTPGNDRAVTGMSMQTASRPSGLEGDLLDALQSLGYADRLARDTAHLILQSNPDSTLEEAIKLCLQELYRRSSVRSPN